MREFVQVVWEREMDKGIVNYNVILHHFLCDVTDGTNKSCTIETTINTIFSNLNIIQVVKISKTQIKKTIYKSKDS